ncbi:SEA (Seh1-associated) complex subunit, partial [Dimargaris xerosporica]
MASGSVASSVVTAPHDKLAALLAQFAAPITHSVHKDIVGISPAPNGSNHLAIVGNDLSCVLEIGEQGISGEIPLKPGSSINAFNKFTQVCWCKADDTHYRVVAATATGGIYVWDPFSPGTRLITHRRELSRINQIVVRPHEPNQFLTVSSNGVVKLWDLRDLGSPQVVYQRRGENFVNAQFNPFDNFDFVIAEESGSLNRIDVRSRASLDRTFAHTKGVKSMHWNPESRWLATAGSDKLIKVWDMQESRFRRNEQTIYTQGSLKSVRWRPGIPRELASCHSASDGLVYLWNLDRPLIPRAFIDCVDPVVDIVFRDSHKLWAVCERGLFRQTDFRRATITEDLFPRNKVHWSPRGDMVFLSSRHHQRNPMDQALSILPALPLEPAPTQTTLADLADRRPDGRTGASHSTTASMPNATSSGSQLPPWSPLDTRPGYSAKTVDIPISNLLSGGSFASHTPTQRDDDDDDDGIEALPLNSESRRPSTSYRDAVIRPSGTPSPHSHLAGIGSSDPGASKGSDLG